MDNAPEVIRQQMQETRASLSEKIGTLEHQVVQTVQDATCAVHDTVTNIKESAQETIDTVKDSVQDTVQAVRDTVNVRLQVQRHPWSMVAGSMAVGFAAGALLPRQIERLRHRDHGLSHARMPREWPAREEAPSRSEPIRDEQPAGPSWLSKLADSLAPEIDKLRGMGVGALMGVVRDVVSDATPEKFQSQIRDLFNDLTTKLGGAPIHGRVMSEKEAEGPDEQRDLTRMGAVAWERHHG